MAYAELADIRAATGFTDDTKISDATINAYLADADSVVNAKLSDVYLIPLSPETPEIIETIARHITIALLYSNEYGEESQDTDKGWRGRMEWAMDQLTEIQKQRIKLRDSNGNELDRSSFYSVGHKPTSASSEADATDSDAPKLTMNMQF